MAPLFLPAVPLFGFDQRWRAFQWKGLSFENPIGVAGGVDKSGKSLKHWQRLGAGFLEVGTVTPLPQSPNPGTIMMRSLPEAALWNKMGFPSPGLDTVEKSLSAFQKVKTSPLFVNIGKNRDTPNGKAHEDYITCLQRLNPFADVFVVNISSPNTKGLRDLQESAALQKFLEPIDKARKELPALRPLLLKISPDLSEQSLKVVLQVSLPFVEGWILTNTTNDRSQVKDFPIEGGVSGRPLRQKSRAFLKTTMEILGEDRKGKLIVSAGGVDSAQEVQTRLSLGADLVQSYSALVFEGPYFFAKTLRNLRALSR